MTNADQNAAILEIDNKGLTLMTLFQNGWRIMKAKVVD